MVHKLKGSKGKIPFLPESGFSRSTLSKCLLSTYVITDIVLATGTQKWAQKTGVPVLTMLPGQWEVLERKHLQKSMQAGIMDELSGRTNTQPPTQNWREQR